jgi:hypothetical protein
VFRQHDPGRGRAVGGRAAWKSRHAAAHESGLGLSHEWISPSVSSPSLLIEYEVDLIPARRAGCEREWSFWGCSAGAAAASALHTTHARLTALP